MTAMPSLRHLWKNYKRTVLQEGLGIRRRNEVEILTQNAFYLGARSVLQCLAFLLKHGHEDDVHEFIERHGRQLKATRGDPRRKTGIEKCAAPDRPVFAIMGTASKQMGRIKMPFQSASFRACVAALFLSASLAASACGGASSKVDGVYANSNGQSTVEFRDGKAFVTIVGGGSDATPYDVKGDTITIHVGGVAGDLVLTRNSDGTLQGPFGIMRKK